MNKKTRLILMIFGGFLVFGVAVLAFGMWRKGSMSGELRERLSEAQNILDSDLGQFVRQNSDERKKGLKRARKLRGLLEADPKAPAETARGLRAWVVDRVELLAAVEEKKRELAAWRRKLQHEFLDDPAQTQAAAESLPCKQLSSAEAQRVREAARKAEDFATHARVRIRGEDVDCSLAIRGQIQGLQSAAKKAIRELDLREAAFTSFVKRAEQALVAKRYPQRAAGELDRWFFCVVNADATENPKEARLRDIEKGMAFVAPERRQEMKRILHERVKGVVGSLQKATEESEIRLAISHCGDIEEAARRLLPDKEAKAWIDQLAKARTTAVGKLGNQGKTAQAVKANQKTIEDIIYKGGGLTEKKSETEWNQAVGPIRSAVNKAKKANPGTGFLATLLDATKPEPPKPKPIANKPIYWVGPDWRGLDANVKQLESMKAEYLKRSKQAKFPLVDKGYSKPFREHYLGAYRSLLKYIDAYGAFKRWYDGEVKQRRDHEKKKAEKAKAEKAKAATQKADKKPPPGTSGGGK